MRIRKLKDSAEREAESPRRLATQKAARASDAGMDAPCDHEMRDVFAEVAAGFGGFFNEYTDDDGVTQYDWQFHLPPGITIAKMRAVMTSLGFDEFVNLNARSHHPTLPFRFGGYHWKGNVRGNWYHIEFRLTRRRSTEVFAADAHYDVDRPSYVFHRTATGKQKCSEPHE